ncbi:hypothetical protein NKG94_05160 [Micromonospora sp. M12]
MLWFGRARGASAPTPSPAHGAHEVATPSVPGSPRRWPVTRARHRPTPGSSVPGNHGGTDASYVPRGHDHGAGRLAGTAGVAEARPSATPPPSATPTPTVTPSPSPTITCPPALPITGSVTGATTTSLTISYSIFFRPPCGYDPPMTVSLFASRDDAQQWRAPVAVAVSGPERNGSVTIDRLTPDTEYWYRFSDVDGRRDPYWIASARTAR